MTLYDMIKKLTFKITFGTSTQEDKQLLMWLEELAVYREENEEVQ